MATTSDISTVTQPSWIWIFTRPSLDIPWFWETLPESHREYINEKYRQPGIFRSEIELSEDGLTVANSGFFINKESADLWAQDTYLIQKSVERNDYNIKNGIERLL